MAWTPTAHHARNLFTLMIEGRFGARWAEHASPQDVARVAEDVVRSFGGAPEHVEDGPGGLGEPPARIQWSLPDGSLVLTGGAGLSLAGHDDGALVLTA